MATWLAATPHKIASLVAVHAMIHWTDVIIIVIIICWQRVVAQVPGCCGEMQLDCVLLLLLLLLPPSGVPEGVCCCPSGDPRAADGCLQTGDVSTPQLV